MTKPLDLSAERIIILDNESGRVFIRFVPTRLIEADGDEILEHFAKALKLHAGDCTYMVVNDDDYLDDTTVTD